MFTSGISKSEDGESSNTSSDWACVSECSVATYDPFEQQPGNRSAASGAQLGQASSCPVTLSLAELLPTTPQIGSQGQASCVGGDGGHAQPREHCLPVNLDGLVLTSPPPWMKVEQVGSVPRGMEESDEVDFVAVSWSCVAEADPDNLECDSEADAGEEHVEPPASAKKAKKKKPRLGKKQRKKKRLILEQGALASIAESTANSGAEVAETETTTDIQLSQARHMSTTHGQAGKERAGSVAAGRSAQEQNSWQNLQEPLLPGRKVHAGSVVAGCSAQEHTSGKHLQEPWLPGRNAQSSIKSCLFVVLVSAISTIVVLTVSRLIMHSHWHQQSKSSSQQKHFPDVVTFVYGKNGWMSMCTGDRVMSPRLPRGYPSAAYKWDGSSDCPEAAKIFSITIRDACSLETHTWLKGKWVPLDLAHAFLTHPVRLNWFDVQKIILSKTRIALPMERLFKSRWNDEFVKTCFDIPPQVGRHEGAFDLASSEGGHSMRVGDQVSLDKWNSADYFVPGLMLRGVRYFEGKYCSLPHRFAIGHSFCPLACSSNVYFFHMPFGVWVPYMRAEVYIIKSSDSLPFPEDDNCSSWQGPQYNPSDYLSICDSWVVRMIAKNGPFPCQQKHRYEVVPGDTLSEIALENSVKMSSILRYPANKRHIFNWDLLHPGLQMYIPQSDLNCSQ